MVNGRRYRILLSIGLVAGGACSQSPQPEPERGNEAPQTSETRTAALISDQTNGGGKTGFYWIPPIVTSAAAFTTLDQTGGSNNLSVSVDQLLADSTTVPKVSFTGTAITMVTGSSNANFPGVAGPFYGVNWVAGTTVAAGETYRLIVRALTPARVLGVADVQVVANSMQAGQVDRTRFTPLIAGSTSRLAIVFRLESKDTDGDTRNDWRDNCPFTRNLNQLDSDADGRGDACQCLNVPNGTACSTGCKTGMTCQSGACTGGTPVTNGTACSTGNPCKQNETCSNGACGGGGNKSGSCSTGNPCKQNETCSNGACVGSNRAGSCSTGNPCKQNETCSSGLCGGGTNRTGSCSTGNPCKQNEMCTSGVCGGSNKVDGTACGDGNLCTQTDTCQGGICMGSNPITCLTACHDPGTCNMTTGVCPARKANGAACTDSNACTQNDSCQAGVCTGSPVTCAADQCHAAGACDPATGCPAPKPNGSACDDGNPCTEFDGCIDGTCQGAQQHTCVSPDVCQEAGTCNPAATSPLPPSTQDLIAWWKLDGDGTDATGSGHDLDEGGAVRAPGRVGFGMKFDGSSCMSAPIWDDARMQTTSGLTLMAWINPNDPAGCPYPDQYGMRAVMGRGWDYSFGVMCMSPSPGPGVTGAVRRANAVQWGWGGGWGQFPPDQWHHFAMTWDRQRTYSYLDGKLFQVVDGPFDNSDWDPQFTIGCMTSYYWSGDEHIKHFKGTVDEAMLYGRALSPEEIWSYYAAADPCPHAHHPDGEACLYSHCSQGDTCSDGICRGGQPVVCTAPDSCHEPGTCYWWAGCVEPPVKPDGAACSDGQQCTQSERCQAGSCQAPAGVPTILNLPVADLGNLGGSYASAQDVNSAGVVVGSSTLASGESHAFRWPVEGAIGDMGLPYPGGASGVNDRGDIAGSMQAPNGWHAFRYLSGFGELQDLGLVGDGSVSTWDLGFPVQGSFGRELNNVGQVVGNYTNQGGIYGFRYSDGFGGGTFEDIGTLEGGLTYGWGIGDDGTVVGSSWVAGTPQENNIRRLGHAVMFQNPIAGLVDMNDLIDPLLGWTLIQAIDIAGDYIVGTGDLNGKLLPFRYRISSHVIEPISGGWAGFLYGNDVNQSGDVVGWGALDAAGTQFAAYVYTDQLGFKRLNEIVDPSLGWDLRIATSINDAGMIVGPGAHAGVTAPYRVTLPSGHDATCGVRNTCGGGDGDGICLYSDGVVDVGGGKFVAVFGFDNPASSSVRPSVNQVGLDGGPYPNVQPSPPPSLPSGNHPGGYLPKFDVGHTITWTVNGETVTASAENSRHLPPVVIGTSGIGVVIDGQTIVIKADVAPYATIPDDPTQPIPGPMIGEQFNGVLKGQLGVSPTGAATYTVPIAIPPGIAGMAPNLSLVYNSQTGNGIAGQGWELSGLSAIHRCNTTLTQDDFANPLRNFPRYSAGTTETNPDGPADSVCLDGKRMFLRGSNRYELESQDFSDITSTTGTTFESPQEFTVVTKSGETRHYGHRPDSRVIAGACAAGAGSGGACQAVITTWLLDKVIDVWGNYFEIHYNHDRLQDDIWNFDTEGVMVTEIKYTGNIGNSSADPTPTFASVVFDYQNRPDARYVRVANARIPRKKRLATITTKLGATTVGTYTLTYKHDFDAALAYGPDNDPMLPSRLASIGYCAGATCLRSLDFDWDGGGYSWEQQPHAADVGQANSYEPPVALNAYPPRNEDGSQRLPGTQFVDLDGDGLQDLVQSIGTEDPNYPEPTPPSVTHVWRNNGHGWEAKDSWALPAGLVTPGSQQLNGYFADLDGDGRLDLIAQTGTCGGYCGRDVAAYLNRINVPGSPAWVRDTAHGDNRHGETDWFDVAIMWWANPESPIDNGLRFDRYDTVADMDGDGRADVVHMLNPLRVALNKPTGWTITTAYQIPPSMSSHPAQDFHLADLNRDGLPDLVHKDGEIALVNGGTHLNGDGTIWRNRTVNGDLLPDVKENRVVADVDGDGLHDVMWHYLTGAEAPFTLHTGLVFSSGFNYMAFGSASFVGAASNEIPFTGSFGFGDVNADGLADLITFRDHIGPVLMVNTGTTFLKTTQGNALPAGTFMDLNADGVADKVQASNDFGTVTKSAWINKFQPPIIKGFPNGVAQPSQVKYDVITTAEAQAPGGTYSDHNPRIGAHTYMTVPLRVVASIAADDGLGTGTTANTTYRYESLRSSAFGRGPQGFMKVSVTDPTRITTVTEYKQVYPYTGLVWKVTRYASISTNDSQPESQDRALVKFAETETSYCDTTVEVNGVLQCSDGLSKETEFRKTRFVYPHRIVNRSWMLRDSTGDFAGNADNITTTSDIRYDSHGNAISTKVRTESSAGEVYISSTTNSYGQAGSLEERLGKITQTIVKTRKGENGTDNVRTTRYDFGLVSDPGGELPFPQTLALMKTTVEPGTPFEQQTVIAHDQFGNVGTTTVCASDFDKCWPGAVNPRDPLSPDHPPFRTTSVSYDIGDFELPPGTTPPPLNLPFNYGRGRFPVKTTNAYLQAEYSVYDPRTGQLRQKTGPNGVHTCIEYDDLGNKRTEIQRCNSGSELRTTFNQYEKHPNAANPFGAPAKLISVVIPPDGAMDVTWADALGRTVVTAKRSFDAGMSQTYSIYDGTGRLRRTTKPFFGQSMYFATTFYDDLGRVKSTEQEVAPIDGGPFPDVSLVTTTYQGFTTTVDQRIAGAHQVRSETKNALGKTAAVTQEGVTIAYGYDADGNLTEAGDPTLQNQLPTVQMHYDRMGRKDYVVDPDLGTWRYVYNAFGDLIRQTDAKNVDTTLTYDALGRMIRRTDPAGTAEWVYDVEPGGVGKLAAVVSAPDSGLRMPCTVRNATLTDGNRVGRAFRYTALGEPLDVEECVEGETFLTSYEYDQLGRQSAVKYPQVGGDRLEVEYHYTHLGFLHYLTNRADGSLLWKATQMNALGQVTRETTGNGVETISNRNVVTGWLMGSTSTAHADGDTPIQVAAYHYDLVGNLTYRTRGDAVSGGVSDEWFGYDPLNRLTSTTVSIAAQSYTHSETFAYDSLGNITEKDGKTYYYNTGCTAGGRAAGPHAVCSVGAGSPYVYDDNGNVIVGADRSIQYNAANKPTHITHNGNQSAVSFVYDADGNRVVQEAGPVGATGTSLARTVYVGMGNTGKSIYERTTKGGSVEHTQFVYAGGVHGGNAFALRVTTGTAVATKYQLFDHLGSVTTISDEVGHVVTADWGGPDATVLSYDAWGARRQPSGRAPDPGESFHLQPGHREFTGHETIPEVGLVNMNGRVYDPVLGRFLSPDPNVQFAGNLQSYNRYSYVLNNPLRNTDPTGYLTWSDVGMYTIYATMAVVVGLACVYTAGAGCVAATIWLAGINAAVMYTNGASWGQIAAVTAVNIVVGQIAGAAGSLAGSAFEQPLAAMVVGGAVSGAISSVVSTAAFGGDLSWENIALATAQGVFTSAVTWVAMGAPVSQASALEQQGLTDKEKADLERIRSANTKKTKDEAIQAKQVLKRNLGDLPVEIYGGTSTDREAAYSALKTDLTKGGPVAKKIATALIANKGTNGKPLALSIVIVEKYSSYSVPYSNEIVVDKKNDIGAEYISKNGGGRFTYERIIAHELGHAALGYLDYTADPEYVVRNVENPIMRAAMKDFNDRTKY